MAYYSCHINRYKYEWYYKGDDKTVWRDMCHDSYFDLLTVPLVTLGMPLTILLSTDDSAISEKWRKLIVCSLSWVMVCYGLQNGFWLI